MSGLPQPPHTILHYDLLPTVKFMAMALTTWTWKCARYAQTLMRNTWKRLRDDAPWSMLSSYVDVLSSYVDVLCKYLTNNELED